MPFRIRPFRPKIYEPMKKYGIVLEDAPFILLTGFLFFFLSFFFDLRLYGFPLATPGLFIGFIIGIAFFKWMRVGKRAGYAAHLISDFLTSGSVRRGWLPSDLETKECRRTSCIIEAEPSAAP